jgi:ketosteroid isomerase-like protein
MLAACATTARHPDAAVLQREVGDTERAFAATMAQCDLTAFSRFSSDDAIFFSGGKAIRGRQQVVAAWAPLFTNPEAPFSWTPDDVNVVDSGALAMTSGPVYDAQGREIARFRSVWRQEAPGVWRIVFDKGEPQCPAAP